MNPPDDDDLVARLRGAGCVFAEDEAAVLREASDGDPERLDRMLGQRLAGRPLEQVVGWSNFAGVRVGLLDGVFVPRQRSALLVDLACQIAPPAGILLDLCCGSGALAMAVTGRRPDLSVLAGDVDDRAVACARLNLPDAEVYCGDLFDPVPARWRGTVDVLVVNAPYVPSAHLGLMPPEAREHEPRLAHDGGPDGLDIHRRVATAAPDWLSPGGALLIEVAERQGAPACGLLEGAGLRPRTVHDPERGASAIVATR